MRAGLAIIALVALALIPPGPAAAHKPPVHQGLADVALGLYEATLPPGVTPEIATYWSQVRTGAKDEDEPNHDHAFDYVLPFLGHFWDADAADPANSRYDDPTLGTYPNAYQKARRVWAMAIGEYTQGRKAEAYHYLGHVTHLLGDMSVPAHVHLDEHGVSGDDSFEDWMYAGNDAPSPEALAALEALGPIDLGAEPVAETRADTLFWLMYTTNQYADFFPSDSNDGDAVSGPWAWSALDLADLQAEFADPLTAADLYVNDVDDTDALGHLSTIRDHVYVRGVRATAALFELFDEAVQGTTATVVINRVSEMPPGHWSIPRHDYFNGPDYYAIVRIDSGTGGFGGMVAENRGNQVGNDRVIASDREIRTGWSFGTAVQPGNGRMAVAIDIYDADTNAVLYYDADDHSDITPTPGRTLDLEVDVEKCLLGEAGAIYGTGDDTGLTLKDPNAAGRCGVYTNIDGGDSPDDRSVLAFTIAMTPPAGTVATSTTVTSTGRLTVPGEAVTWTATVAGAGDLGNVAFVADGAAIAGCEARDLVGAVATCTSSALPVGSHDISATYLGFPGFASSTGQLSDDQVVAPILGVGPVTFEPTTVAVGDGPIDVVIADLDGTAELEVAALVFNPATSGSNTGDVAIARADGAAFSLDQTIHTTGEGATDLAAGDINKDGHLDLAIGNKSAANILVGLGRAPGVDGSLSYTWSSFPVTGSSGGTPAQLAIGDLDGLRGLDLAATISRSDEVVIGIEGAAATLDYHWTRLATGDGPRAVEIADVNADGRRDVVVACVTGTVAVHLAGATPGTFNPPVHYAVGSGLEHVEIADLNDDGRADLIVPNPLANSVSVLVGAASPGTFGPALTYAVGPGPFAVAIGDLNLDERTDIAVAHNDGTASLLLGVEGGGYLATSPIPVGAGPWAIAIGQVDTGALDVVTADYYGNTITVLHNATTAQGATTTVLAACPAPPVDPADPEDGVAPEVPDAAAACPAPDPGSNASAVYGQPVVLRATVAPAIGSGVVQFRADGVPVEACIAQPLVEGEGTDAGTYAATCTVYGLPVGQRAIVAEFGGTAGLEASTSLEVGLTITKKPLAVDAAAATKTYGSPDPAFTWTLRGFIGGDDAATAGVSGSAECARVNGTETVGVGFLYEYADEITCEPGTLTSESYTFETGRSAGFTIEPATLHLDANPATKEFGEPDPALGGTLDGFVNGEDAASAGVQGAPSCSRTPGETVAGSPYAINCRTGTLAAPNYRIVPGNAADFTITQRPSLSVDAVEAIKTYGEADPVLEWTLRGFLPGEDATSAGVTGAAVCSRAPGENVADGPYPITCTPGTLAAPNYTFETGDPANLTITRAPSTTVASCPAGPFTYTGLAQTPCSVRVTGGGGLDFSPDPVYADNVNAGTASASYAYPGDPNHEASSDEATFTIEKAGPACSIVGWTGPYDGALHGASGTCLGVAAELLAGLDLGEQLTNVPGGSAHWMFTDATGNYTDDDDWVDIVIGKADTTVTVTCAAGPFTYTGSPIEPCTASVAGPGGLSQALTVVYANNTNAGLATATASYAESDNHQASAAAGTFTIAKAAPACTILGWTGTYDGAPHGASGTCRGVEDETLAGIVLGDSFTDVPGGAADWTFTDVTGNYTDDGGSVGIVIEKADTTVTVTCAAGPFTYTGLAQAPCSVRVTGAGGLDLAPEPVYADNVSAGTVSASYAYPGDANHQAGADSATFTIGRAALSVDAVAAGKTYGADDPALAWTLGGFVNGEDATDAGVTGAAACTRTEGEDVATSPYPITCQPGTLAAPNYTFVAGEPADFTIGKADTTVTVTCAAGPFTYSGSPIEACTAAVTGPGGLSQPLTVEYADNIGAGPATASARYAESANHNGSADTRTFTIDEADTSLSVASMSSVYSEQAVVVSFTATVSNTSTSAPVNEGTVTFAITDGTTTVVEGTSAMVVAGVATEQLTLPPDTAVGAYAIDAVYDPGSNFSGSSGSNPLTVAQRGTTITQPDATATFGDPSVTLHATVTADDAAPGSTVNQGTVAFTLRDGSGIVGSATTSATVVDGVASVTYAIPVGSDAGSYAIEATFDGTANLGGSSATAKTLTIGAKPTTIAVSAAPNPVQYSDAIVLTATVVPDTAGDEDPTGSVELMVNGTSVGSVAVDGDGVATLATSVSLPAGTYPVAATFTSTNPNFAGSSTAATYDLVVVEEDAVVEYTGDSLGLAGANLTVQATVWDSAAAGYAGANPETGTAASIGTITRMWVRFDIFGVSCGGTPEAAPTVQVVDTGTAGDGIGTATTVFKATGEGTYCVTASIVRDASGAGNLHYLAPLAQTATITFYDSIGQFVTGGGWVTDPTGGHGNFGFNARYSKKGQPQGQVIYVWRGQYGGVPADFKIKSNALDALSFTGEAYPLSATLQGKANFQITRASDGVQLYGSGNGTFVATAFDTNMTPSIRNDTFTLTFTENGASIPYQSFTAAPLEGGNVVIHLK